MYKCIQYTDKMVYKSLCDVTQINYKIYPAQTNNAEIGKSRILYYNEIFRRFNFDNNHQRRKNPPKKIHIIIYYHHKVQVSGIGVKECGMLL